MVYLLHRRKDDNTDTLIAYKSQYVFGLSFRV